MGNDISDVYDQAFIDAVSGPAALGAECKSELCSTWMSRFAADRPHLTGTAAQVPIKIAYGAKDTAIGPERLACVLDRLDTDHATYEVCLDAESDHTSIVYNRSDYAADWIAARTLGAAEPASCGAPFVRPTCATPPPND